MTGPFQPDRGFIYPTEWFVSDSDVAQVMRLLNEGAVAVGVVGAPGSGKSAVLADVARRFDGPVIGPLSPHDLRGSWETTAAELMRLRPEGPAARTLVVVDSLDELPASSVSSGPPTRDLIERLAQVSQVLVASRPPWPDLRDMPIVEVSPPPFAQVIALFKRAGLSRREVERALEDVFQGRPTWRAAIQLLNERYGAFIGPDAPDLTPVNHTSLLGPDGRPLDTDDKRYGQHVVRLEQVSDDLLRWLRDRPDEIYRIDPRKFEEVVAELLSRQGYAVELTPPSSDGGIDIRAAMHNELGSFLYLVEAKRYAAHRPVGVGVVRHLAGVVHAQRATAGVLVTTSHYTRHAQEFQQTLVHQISLRQFSDLRAWLSFVE